MSLDGSVAWDWLFPNVGGGWTWGRINNSSGGPWGATLTQGWHELRISNLSDGAQVDAIALAQGWSCTPVSAGCGGAQNMGKPAGLAAAVRFAAPQAAPPVSRFAHGEYFESDPGWESAGGYADAVDSVYRLNTWYANDATTAVAPWTMTAGHLRARVRAVTNGARRQNAQLIFDYQDATHYKIAGLRVDDGQWVIKAVGADNSETLLASATGSITVGQWYQLDLVVELNKVTLYADGQEKVAWPRGSGRLTGGRVGVMVRDGKAEFQELEVWDVTAATKTYALGGQRVALRRDGVLSYVHTDHLGSTSVLTDASGHEIAGTRLKYYPFGAPRPDGASGTHNAFATGYSDATFTGQRRDVGTGLYFYGARYYDSAIGRFIQPDTIVQSAARDVRPVLPLIVSYAEPGLLAQWNEFQLSGRQADAPHDPQLLNHYTYVRNNPLAYRDDSGHWIWMVVGGFGGAIVGFGAYALTHQDNFDWKQAALWTGGGALIGATLGGATELVVGAVGAQAAATAATASPWLLSALQRGQVIEDMLGRNLARNFPTIDRFANGIATSIKSLDLTAQTYQTISNLTSKVQGYLNSVAGFQGYGQITPNMISARELVLAIPSGAASQAQLAALQALQQAAANQGVILTIVQIP